MDCFETRAWKDLAGKLRALGVEVPEDPRADLEARKPRELVPEEEAARRLHERLFPST